jgi:hypothetical protein
MSEITSSHPSAACFSANTGEGAELDKLTKICENARQSANITCGKLKYGHVNSDFYNNRKLGQALFGELLPRPVFKALKGDVEYAS